MSSLDSSSCSRHASDVSLTAYVPPGILDISLLNNTDYFLFVCQSVKTSDHI